MAISPENAQQLVEQLQHAHRLSVAFYRRFLPILDNIADQLGCQFLYWCPMETSMPCRSSTRPSSPWAWDFVPLFASKHLYLRREGNTATPQDVGLSLRLHIDDGFSLEKRRQNGVKGQPDAVTLPMGKAILRSYVFRPSQESNRTFDDLWNKAPCPPLNSENMLNVNSEMKAVAFEWSLADLLQNHQVLVDKLKPYTE